MILQEHHKQFAVRSYAYYMNRKQVVNAIVQEYPNDIPKPTPPPEHESIIDTNKLNKETDNNYDEKRKTRRLSKKKTKFHCTLQIQSDTERIAN